MKSRTSFSKLTTFKKDITRFAPVWALYLIGLLLVLTDTLGYGDYDRVGYNMGDVIMIFSIVNLIYAGVVVTMLFGDLYNTRMCYSLHTLPQRRETWLLSHLGAAMLFSLVPNALAALYMMVRLESYWFLALYWLLAAELQYLFFLGVAVISALLAGNRFAMLVIYAVLNFFSMITYWVVETIYLPMLTGVILDFEICSKLCPVVDLCSNWEFFTFERVETLVTDSNYGGTYTDIFYKYTGLSTGWGYTSILAGIGLVLMGLAVLLYRKRHLECAGDFVAFRRLSPVVCVILTICVGAGMAFVGDMMLGNNYIPWLIVGLVVGYFGSLMLLERRIKVFRGKTFLGFGVLAAVLVASFLAIAFDVFNIVGYVPQADKVQSVTLANFNSSLYYDYDYFYSNRISVMLEDEEDIENAITVHKDILARLDEEPTSTHRVVITYKLESGRTVKRSYYAPAYGVNYEIVRKYFYTPQQTLGYTDWEEYLANVSYLTINGSEIGSSNYTAVLEALRKDCEAGFVYTNGIDSSYWAEVETRDSNGSYVYRYLMISEEAEHIFKVLQDPAILLGSDDLKALQEGLYWLDIDNCTLESYQYESLLEALYADASNGTITMGYGKLAKFTVQYQCKLPNGDSFYRYLCVSEKAENTLKWYQDNCQ